MLIQELQKSIIDKDNKHIYFFTGEEIYVRDVYIQHIVNTFSNDLPVRCDTVSQAMEHIQKPRISGSVRVFIVSDDKTYIKEEKAWQTVNNAVINGNDILILIYNSVDKRSKFYKHYKDIICEFEKLSDELLFKYISKDIDLSDDNINKLISLCGGNYNRIRLEEDKIKQYAECMNCDYNTAFTELLNCGVIYEEIGDITFRFIDSILYHNMDDILKYKIQAKKIKEPELLTLSVLFKSLVNIYQVQSLPKNTKDIAKKLNLTPWQIKLAREKSGIYSNEDIIYILKLITKLEQGIKMGKIDSAIAIDYLLINML